MFLKRERPETDEFAIKKSGCEEKILSRNLNISRNNGKLVADTLRKKI